MSMRLSVFMIRVNPWAGNGRRKPFRVCCERFQTMANQQKLCAIGEGAHVESPQIMMHTHGSALKGRYTTEVFLPGKASISPCVGIIQIRSRVGTAFCSLSAGCASSPFTRPILSNSQYPVKVSDQSGYCQSENVTVFSSDFHRTVTIQTQIRNVSMVTAPASHRGIPHKSATSEPRSSH